jgi:isopenicillin N synthase-like dioxygenase
LNPGKDKRLKTPKGISNEMDSFSTYIRSSYDISILILKTLSDTFGLEGNERYENSHRPDGLSTSTAVMQYYPLDLPADTSVGHFTHTDTGSITILFNTEWGLQVCVPGTDRWEYVEPKPNHAIINVGDSLKFLSQSKLRSSLHRVVPCHSRWKTGARQACIFFLRPNHEAEVVDTEGQRWRAVDWLNKKFGNYRASHEEQYNNAVATGRKGFLGLWEGGSPQQVVV